MASLLALGQVRSTKCYSQKSADIRCRRTPMLFWLDTKKKPKKQKSMCFQMETNQFSKKKVFANTKSELFTEAPVWFGKS